jgi:hypothetical protein
MNPLFTVELAVTLAANAPVQLPALKHSALNRTFTPPTILAISIKNKMTISRVTQSLRFKSLRTWPMIRYSRPSISLPGNTQGGFGKLLFLMSRKIGKFEARMNSRNK